MSEKLEILKDLDSLRERLSNLKDVVIIADDKYKQKWELLKLTLDKMEVQNSVIIPSSSFEGSKVKIEKETKVKTIGYIRAMMEEMESSYAYNNRD